MATPVWVITGPLDSGKTTLINQLVEQGLDELDILAIQSRSGETLLIGQERVEKVILSKGQLKQSPFGIADIVIHYIDKHGSDLVLIERNGVEHFHKLEEMLLQLHAKAMLSAEKVVHVMEGASFKTRVPEAGVATFSQVACYDCTYMRLKGSRRSRNNMSVLYGYNLDIQVYTSWNRFVRALFRLGIEPRHWFLMLLTAVMLYMAIFSVLNGVGVLPEWYISIFLGVFLQAVPFLAVGALFSPLIQVYLKPDWIQRRLPRKILAGQLLVVLAGFCLPVCDCASIPVSEGLVKKRVSIPAAMTFTLVPPVTSPVVIPFTWYAFNGDYRIIVVRYSLGILCPVLCGSIYLSKSSMNYLVEDAIPIQVAYGDHSLLVEEGIQLFRFSLTMQHAQNKSSLMGKFLLTRIFVPTLFQDMIPRAVAAGGVATPWRALLVMMGLASVLSLCSSSDAVVARSMAGNLPVGVVLGLSVFGPMMDIRNAAMSLSDFKNRFAIRLLATTFSVCPLMIGIFMIGGSGRVRI